MALALNLCSIWYYIDKEPVILEQDLFPSSLLWRPTQLYLRGGGRRGWAKNWGTIYSSLQLTYTFKTRKITQKSLETPQFWTERRGSSPKMLKSAEKIQDQRLDQKFATSERKQQEKWQIIQIFRDNFSSLETKQQAVKSAVRCLRDTDYVKK